jgi:hypothetical protein
MYIYLTINIIDGKTYIGKRQKSSEKSKNYLGSGRRLANAINKYGKENFKKFIIDENLNYSKEELSNLEIEYIFNLKPNYNISLGGDGGSSLLYNPNRNEIIRKIKENHQTPEYRKKASIKSKRNWQDPIYRNKMMEYFKSDKFIPRIKHLHDGNKKWWSIKENKKKYAKENLIGDKNPFFGKHHTKETKKDISNKIKNKWKDPEYKKKMSKVRKNQLQPRGDLSKNSKLVTDKQYYLIVVNFLNNVPLFEIIKKLGLTRKVLYNRLKWLGLKK